MLIKGVLTLLSLLGPASLLFAEEATLSWDPSPDTDVVGYHIYHGTTSGQYTDSIQVGNTTQYTFPLTTSGVHYFVVTAYNSPGIESRFSNEVSKVIAENAGNSGKGGCALNPHPGRGPLDAAEMLALISVLFLLTVKRIVCSFRRSQVSSLRTNSSV